MSLAVFISPLMHYIGRILLLLVLLSGAGSLSTYAMAQESKEAAAAAQHRVLVTHPIVYGLLSFLTQDSVIALERVTPQTLPFSRYRAYLSGRGAKDFATQAQHAEALVSLRSIWPDDPLYPLARQYNIRIVEIDAAKPIDGLLPGIALSASGGHIGDYPWLDLINMGRMLDILGSELKRLVPQEQTIIERNLATAKQKLLQLNVRTESALLELPDVAIISLSPRITTLVNALNLEVEHFDLFAKPGQENGLEALTALIKQQTRAVLLVSHEALPAAIAQALEAMSVTVLIIPTEGDDPLLILDQAITRLLQTLKELA